MTEERARAFDAVSRLEAATDRAALLRKLVRIGEFNQEAVRDDLAALDARAREAGRQLERVGYRLR
jgi:hypothetical protein